MFEDTLKHRYRDTSLVKSNALIQQWLYFPGIVKVLSTIVQYSGTSRAPSSYADDLIIADQYGTTGTSEDRQYSVLVFSRCKQQ
jgi:hypothetical protein